MLVMIKAILHERTVAVCASMDFGKGLRRSEPWGDSRKRSKKKSSSRGTCQDWENVWEYPMPFETTGHARSKQTDVTDVQWPRYRSRVALSGQSSRRERGSAGCMRERHHSNDSGVIITARAHCRNRVTWNSIFRENYCASQAQRRESNR